MNKWKADEMEMTINFKAMRLSYIFMTFALLIYCLVDLSKTGDLPTIPCAIVNLSTIIFFSSKIWMTKRMTEGSEDEE